MISLKREMDCSTAEIDANEFRLPIFEPMIFTFPKVVDCSTLQLLHFHGFLTLPFVMVTICKHLSVI
jgi:hypothetical protein